MLIFALTGTKNLFFHLAWTCCDMKGLEHIDHFCKFIGEGDLFVMKSPHEHQQGKTRP